MRIAISFFIFIMAQQMSAQDKYVEINGKFYVVEEQQKINEEVERIHNEWVLSIEKEDVKAQFIGDWKEWGKKAIEWALKHRMTEKEKSVYNYGVKSINEDLQFELLKYMEK